MPTAVITESSEKTMSSARICASVAPNPTVRCASARSRGRRRPRSPAASPSPPSTLLVKLVGRLGHQEQAAGQQHQIAPRKCAGRAGVNSGARQPHEPAQPQQQRRCAGSAPAPMPRRRTRGRCPCATFSRQDRDEDDVVDAEDDLHHREADQADQPLGPEEHAQKSSTVAGRFDQLCPSRLATCAASSTARAITDRMRPSSMISRPAMVQPAGVVT